MTEYARRAKRSHNQPVNNPHKAGKPSGFAAGLGAGRPGRARSNQIRKLKAIKGRVHGVSVTKSGNTRPTTPKLTRGEAPVATTTTPEIGRSGSTHLVHHKGARQGYQKGTVGGDQRGRSENLSAYKQSDKKNTGTKRRIIRGYVAG